MVLSVTRLARYLLVAAVVYAIDMGGYIFLLQLQLSPALSNLLTKVVAVVFGFYAHRVFTYQIKDKTNLFNHAIKYFGLALLYTPTSSLCLMLMMHFILNPIAAKFVCDVILFVLVYWLTSHFTFLQTEQDRSSPSQ